MSNLILYFFSPIFIGMGATLTFDIWGLFLKHVFKIPPSNFCLVGRWVLYMPEGIFRHENITTIQRKTGECATGWITHYMIGITFAIIFILVVGADWMLKPAFIPALIFGAATVAAPFFIMQPLFGFGFASSKTANPAQAILRSLTNHTAFGVGLYLAGSLFNYLL